MALDYIVANKEWIFSGVGVVVLTGVISLVNYFVKKKQNGATTQAVISNTPNPHTAIAASRGMNYPERLIPTHITRISSISPQEIYASLDAVPPFQKNGLIKSYEGIYIRWNTRLFSATAQSDDEVRLSLDIDKVTYKGVSCSVKLAEYKELGVMPKGTPITVIGKIKEIDSLSISLDDVHLYFTA